MSNINVTVPNTPSINVVVPGTPPLYVNLTPGYIGQSGYSGYSGPNYYIYDTNAIDEDNVYPEGYWEVDFEMDSFANLGVNYYEINYDNCMPFLLMLPNCFKAKP